MPDTNETNIQESSDIQPDSVHVLSRAFVWAGREFRVIYGAGRVFWLLQDVQNALCIVQNRWEPKPISHFDVVFVSVASSGGDAARRAFIDTGAVLTAIGEPADAIGQALVIAVARYAKDHAAGIERAREQAEIEIALNTTPVETSPVIDTDLYSVLSDIAASLKQIVGSLSHCGTREQVEKQNKRKDDYV
jgi:hypothetical protein